MTALLIFFPAYLLGVYAIAKHQWANAPIAGLHEHLPKPADDRRAFGERANG